MAKLTVREIPVAQRRVLVRVDFNVPLDHGGVADDTRIRATLPTLEYLIQQKARAIVCSHLGRPKGKPDAAFSLRPAAERLRVLLDQRLGADTQVGFCPETVGLQAREMAQALEPGHVLLLENLRFQPQEEANDPAFSRELAGLAEVYVNDAFGSAHRAHASTVGVTQFLHPAAAGLLMEQELRYLGQALGNPQHPFVVILGGAKVADKLPVMESLAHHADVILVGGGMAYTFLAAQGHPVGASLCEPDKFDLARAVMARAASDKHKFRLLLPVDHVVAAKLEAGAAHQTVSAIPAGQKALDIGPRTREQYAAEIALAKTIVWNGPMGVFEVQPFDQGTVAIARAVADASRRGAVSIAGGGDSVAAIEAAGVARQITHISTGGGASLEFLAGVPLPGVAALSEAGHGRGGDRR
ncbi:MAG: phosphoglycerate kinase [Terriglobales bacterium]